MLKRIEGSTWSFLVVGILFVLSTIAVCAQSTSFTYQGRLTDGATLANANYDFQFALFDSLASGAQVGSTQTISNVSVNGGIFTVSLDFGAGAFPGANRWLQIAARLSGTQTFTTLSPRQPITSTPYSVRSLNASSADTVVVNGIPSGSGNYIQNITSPQADSNFNVSGNGTAGGTLTGEIVNAVTEYRMNGSRFLAVGIGNSGSTYAGVGAGGGGSNNTFFGSFAGFHNGASSVANTFFGASAGSQNVSGDLNSFFGYGSGLFSTGEGNTFVGFFTGNKQGAGSNNTLIGLQADVGTGNLTNATAIGARAQVEQSNSLVLGSVAGVNGATTSVNVGIGTTTPLVNLHVKGAAMVESSGTGGNISIGTPNGESGLSIAKQGVSRADLRFDGGRLKLVAAMNSLPPADTSGLAITTAGDVGIGITAPTTKLDVNGNVGLFLAPGGSLSVCLTGLTGVGRLAQCSSSLRYKTSVRSFNSGLDLIKRLRPITFTWKANGGTDFGLAAEDVAKVEPLLVTHNAKGEIEGVKYDHLNVVLINAIKEQQKQIETLRAENAALNVRLKSVEGYMRKRKRSQRN
jgi:hypothetical protein